MVNVIYLPAMFSFHMEIKRLLKRLLECDTWVLRVFYYFIFCGTVAAIPFTIFSKLNLSHTDVDSARYMLSALIQSEAAIIAIVVTMSLVAVQLAASSYSVRVVDIFRKKPDLWLLLLTYGFAIFWGLGVLKMIDTKNPLLCELLLFCQSNLESYIVFTYSLGVFAYVALGIYIWDILGLLEPSTMINTLGKDITKKNLLESSGGKNKDENNQNDVLLPIIDIMRSALMNYDYVTVRDGLSAIRVQIKDIFEEISISSDIQTPTSKLNELVKMRVNGKTLGNDFKADWEQNLSNYILTHLTRIRRLAMDKGDEYSTNEIIKTIQIIGVAAAEKKLEKIAYGTIMNLGDVGIEAAKRKLEWSTQMAITAIETIGTKSDENELRMHAPRRRWWEVSDLEQIGIIAIENRLESAAEHVAASLLGVGIRGADKGQNGIAYNITKSLEIMKRSAENKGLLKLTSKISQMRDSVNPISSKNEENSSENN